MPFYNGKWYPTLAEAWIASRGLDGFLKDIKHIEERRAANGLPPLKETAKDPKPIRGQEPER